MKALKQIRETLATFGRFGRECIPPDRKPFFAIWILHVLFAVLLILPPLLIKHIIDAGILAGNVNVVVKLAFIIFGIFVAVAAIDWVRHFWGHKLAQRITYKLRNNLYWHLQKLSFKFYDNIKVGELLSRLIDDLNRGEEILYHAPQIWVSNSVMILLTAGMLFYLDPVLAVICICIVATIGVAAFLVSRKMFAAERKVRDVKADLSAQAEDNLAGVRIIQSFVRERHEMDQFDRKNRAHYQSRIRAVYWWSWLFPVSIVILGIALTLAICLGGHKAITNPDAMSVGALTAFIMYLQRLMFPMLSLFLINERTIQYLAGVERYFSFMDMEPDIRDRPKPVHLGHAQGDVAFNNVWFRYDENDVLKNINLHVPPGQTVALVGPSGTGKTTVTRLIPRFYEPYKGEVTIDGINVQQIALSSLRENIGIVMQDDYLFSDTLLNNIAYGRLDVTRAELIEAAKQANVDQFVKHMPDGYDTEVGQRGVKVSEGQAQRISIARAIVKDPPVLILDEATSSVDSQTELLIQQALERVMQNKTCFMIAHRLSTIVDADVICFVKNGQIAEQGTHQELMDKDGEYAYYYRLQSEGTRERETFLKENGEHAP